MFCGSLRMIDRRYRGKQHISRKIPYDLPQIAACAAHYAEASVNRAAGCPNMVGFAEASEKHAVLDCRANGATAELFLQVEALRAGVLEAHLECGGGRGLLRGHVAVCALGKILAAGVRPESCSARRCTNRRRTGYRAAVAASGRGAGLACRARGRAQGMCTSAMRAA